ncbi:MAG: hypothetical protein EOP09_06370, partial [Proteobacteria bacterium]
MWETMDMSVVRVWLTRLSVLLFMSSGCIESKYAPTEAFLSKLNPVDSTSTSPFQILVQTAIPVTPVGQDLKISKIIKLDDGSTLIAAEGLSTPNCLACVSNGNSKVHFLKFSADLTLAWIRTLENANANITLGDLIVQNNTTISALVMVTANGSGATVNSVSFAANRSGVILKQMTLAGTDSQIRSSVCSVSSKYTRARMTDDGAGLLDIAFNYSGSCTFAGFAMSYTPTTTEQALGVIAHYNPATHTYPGGFSYLLSPVLTAGRYENNFSVEAIGYDSAFDRLTLSGTTTGRLGLISPGAGLSGFQGFIQFSTQIMNLTATNLYGVTVGQIENLGGNLGLTTSLMSYGIMKASQPGMSLIGTQDAYFMKLTPLGEVDWKNHYGVSGVIMNQGMDMKPSTSGNYSYFIINAPQSSGGKLSLHVNFVRDSTGEISSTRYIESFGNDIKSGRFAVGTQQLTFSYLI